MQARGILLQQPAICRRLHFTKLTPVLLAPTHLRAPGWLDRLRPEVSALASRDPHAPLSNSFTVKPRAFNRHRRRPQQHRPYYIAEPLVSPSQTRRRVTVPECRRQGAVLALGCAEACTLHQYLTATGVQSAGRLIDATPCPIHHCHHPTHCASVLQTPTTLTRSSLLQPSPP